MSLTFDKNVKTHDGLCAQSRLLQDLIHAYFEDQILSSQEIAKEFVLKRIEVYQLDSNAICVLCEQLTNLISRAQKLCLGTSIPVLHRGGGKGHKVQRVHCGHLRRLLEWIS